MKKTIITKKNKKEENTKDRALIIVIRKKRRFLKGLTKKESRTLKCNPRRKLANRR